MDRLLLRFRRWGNVGAVTNARAELIQARERDVAATVVARRVFARDARRAAAG